VTNYLSLFGAVGLTAYFGLIDVCEPKAGDMVLVSGAAGAVGSLVGQIAKIKGCRAIGIAGGAAKCARLTERYGFDAAIDYRGKDVAALDAAIRAAAPDGVDIIFENVGSDILDAGLLNLRQGARVGLCGLISEYNAPAPVGEYAMSCLGRERMFEHFSRHNSTRVALIRLNYACDLRYGVLVDLANRVWNGEPIDLTMGYFNTIWQGDANAQTLRAFDLVASPPAVVNVTGPELMSVRAVCEELGKRWQKPVQFVGVEADTALLSNTRRAAEIFGRPRINARQLVEWVADWVMRGGRSLDKPTHFESRSGLF